MIDLETARQLLDFGKRIGGEGPQAEEQLRGAVAIHNLLSQHRRAYLADEVGMGKTYVALGALALFRHFNPDFRVLVIAPRENIQNKWMKELTNFATHNVRFPDMRVVSLDGRPARPLVSCANLIELVHETSVDPHRDFFVRMTSFSLATGKTSEDWKKLREALRHHVPWLKDDALDLRNKEQFKRNFARALCCALPRFDLVIVDEAHNLKHGFSTSGSARNQVLAEAFGRHPFDDVPDRRLFPGHGPRAERVLFLSATPLEESYRHVWNQLDLFGLAQGCEELKADDVSEARKKEVAGRFLVRRVTSIHVGGQAHTKNLYRREWRAGGVSVHDEPIRVQDDRQRLIVALVQKKVSELLSGKRFNRSFQIGMLASFESFLETARLKRDDPAAQNEESIFDDVEQTDVAEEREGIDVRDINTLADDYRKRFGREMPHPKMDAVVDSLSSAWRTGKKTLVFVRRVASVKELKRKLDERYDDWLKAHLQERLPEAVRPEWEKVFDKYSREKLRSTALSAPDSSGTGDTAVDDSGGNDTFFAWFFRGKGPQGWASGANLQARFNKASGVYATFFSDNHVLALLDATPGTVLESLSSAVKMSKPALVDELRQRAARYLSKKAQVVTRGARLEAAQAAALELLKDMASSPFAVRAGIIWEERFSASLQREHAPDAPAEIANALEQSTFFTDLRQPRYAALRELIWPATSTPPGQPLDPETYRNQCRTQELRAQFLSTAARLGHAFIDLYIAMMAGRTTLASGRAEETETEERVADAGEHREQLHLAYLDLLERQRSAPDGTWGALRELAEIAANFGLILDVNAPDIRNGPLEEAARHVASLLRQQQPVGGMAGQINQTLVKQFRMPGYPFVLVTTDLLQEGEDLHTFCSSVHHYGISWTPSAMEQRVGRVDRVRSQTERRLTTLAGPPTGEDWLQVHFPYLEDTVEVLQVERVLDRMGTFLRLMHEGLPDKTQELKKIDVEKEMVAVRRHLPVAREALKTAFPLPPGSTTGPARPLAVQGDVMASVRARFSALRDATLGGVPVEWTTNAPRGALLGTAQLENGRRQPFTLLLRSDHGHPVIRCISPIGRTDPGSDPDAISQHAARTQSRVGAILTRQERSYDLTIEDDVLLAAPEHDAVRVALLVKRVVEQADRMEREHFADDRDEPLESFEEDLLTEAGHDH
ncbi:helicase domain-containing protein [Corallococcus coralloides]|uniref:Helicase domain-containing protein n=1 Tax=Corallococcus coralloides TaxID=184914 RepID=A0A410RM02_CORCK|nr:DEAD/DEAH box helicase [Corallococcus coralloides]QAT82967.1 helicase domain-containing protein [Corallococcus coralloides]